MIKQSLLLIFLILFSGCLPTASKLSIDVKKKDLKSFNASISSVQVIDHQLVIHGVGLNNVTKVVVNGNSLNENFDIESKTNVKITANSLHDFSFDVSKVFSLILSDAQASATFQIDFSLCHASLNGAGFDCNAPIANNDVLAYDSVSNTWIPKALGGLTYRGVWDATTLPPAANMIGQYYIVSNAHLAYAVGDWIVWNGSSFDHVAQSTAGGVSTVFGRPGMVVAVKGDYSLDLLGDVDIPTTPTAGQVLKFDGTNWIADDEAGGAITAGSITSTELAASSVTDAKIVSVAASKITGAITSAQITDGAIVNADINAGAGIDYSKLNIDDGDIPAAKISGLPSATAILATSIVDNDLTHAPDGNSIFDALSGKLSTNGGMMILGTISGIPNPNNDNDVSNKAYTDLRDALNLVKAGDTMTGILTLDNDLRVKGGSNYVTLRGNAASASYVLTLPIDAGTSNQVLTTNGSGALSWTTPSTTAAPSGSAGGDLGGNYPNPTITGLSAAKIGGGTVDNTEFSHLDGVTSSIQTQLNGKESSLATGGTTAQYFRGDKTLGTLNTTAVAEGTNLYFTQPRVIASPLTGVTSTAGTITATDTVLDAFGKMLNTQGDYVSKSANSTVLSQLTVSGTGSIIVPTPTLLTQAANMGYVQSYVDAFGQWTKSGSDIYRSAGKVGIGTSSPENNLSVYQVNATASLGVTSDNTSSTADRYPSINISNYDGNTGTGSIGNPTLNLINYRGNSSTSAVIRSGDPLGSVVFAGSSNASSSYIEGAAVWAFASQNFTSSAGGSELHFYTTTNNTNTPTAKMVVMNDGDVGIGITTPEGPLHVASTTDPAIIQRSSNNNNAAEMKFLKSRGTIASPTAVLANDRLLGVYGDGFYSSSATSTNASAMQMWAAENFTNTGNGTYIDFGTTPIGSTTRQRRMIIEDDGNVGIGTDNPSVKLEVSGDILSASLTTGAINSLSVLTSQLGVSGAVSGYPNTSIRNTSVTGVSGTIYNDNTNTGRAFIGHINASVPAPYPAGTFAMMGVGTALTFGMDANEVMRVHTDGRVGIGTIAPGYKVDVQGGGVNASGGYTQTSDIRLKTNIDHMDSESTLEKIVSLKGIFYDWKDQDKLGSERQIGLIAQDVEKVFPEAVKKNEEGLLSVSYSNLVAPVIEAIKELNKRVIDLFGQTTKHSREIASIKNENALKDEKIKKLERENREMKARLDKIEKMLK